MTTQRPEGIPEVERSPEEAALLARLDAFVKMRWLAVIGVVAATLAASLGFNIGFPTAPVYVVCAFIALYNLLLYRQLKGLRQQKEGSVVPKARSYSNVHIFLDLLALTAILHFTGGIENPFLFFFVLHIMVASIVLPRKSVYLLATAAVLLVATLAAVEYAGIVQHYNLAGFVSPTRYRQPSYIAAVMASLASMLYGVAYVGTAVSGELRKRQRQVVQLRDALIQEKTSQLQKSSQEIAKLEEEKERFLRFIGVAAHDLKAPLAAIQSYLLVILEGFAGEVNEKQRKMLQSSSVRINELIALISDLLDIPRIETGQLVGEMKQVSLTQVLEGSLGEYERFAEEKGLKFNLDLPESPLLVFGSAPRLQQVFTNLVSNALRYTKKGSLTIRARDQGDAVVVEVIDTGVGIPPQDMPQVFEDFFRAGNSDGKGTGLGLSITKRIIDAHGGLIRVDSPCPETGVGCKFTLTLYKNTQGVSNNESKHQP